MQCNQTQLTFWIFRFFWIFLSSNTLKLTNLEVIVYLLPYFKQISGTWINKICNFCEKNNLIRRSLIIMQIGFPLQVFHLAYWLIVYSFYWVIRMVGKSDSWRCMFFFRFISTTRMILLRIYFISVNVAADKGELESFLYSFGLDFLRSHRWDWDHSSVWNNLVYRSTIVLVHQNLRLDLMFRNFKWRNDWFNNV